ncbi:NAD(P)-binding domain [Lasallia pustulata]|uniref:2,4-dienoyl-CoA reductase [(3E)-enoyl-CoA-producing] n=1 Tax=Lasallia pustulata TaxID=136370 RepID=A0A1W5CVX9_9LECA|nr:NAD(P)-binding domain [Lasallia pustulata]
MDLSSNAFKSVIDIDVLGSYNTVKATLPYLLKSAAAHRTNGTDPAPSGTGGRIIFISATVQYTGLPLQAHLSAAKAAVDSLSNTLSIEMGPRGMTSNVRNAASERALKTIPSGRLGSVRETADAAVYLFSDAANYVNGHIIVVDGGAWRMGQGLAGPGSGFEYPDFLLCGNTASDVKGQKKTDAKL